MGCLELEKCCCYSLKTGSAIVAWFAVILAALELMGHVAFLFPGEKTDQHPSLLHTILNIVLAALYFTACILLLVGVKKEKPGFMCPWVFLNLISVIVTIINTILSLNKSGAEAMDAGYLLSVCLKVYFFLVVRSYYIVLRAQSSTVNV